MMDRDKIMSMIVKYLQLMPEAKLRTLLLVVLHMQ